MALSAECCYAECHLCKVSFMASATNKPIMLSVIMLNVVMLSVVRQSNCPWQAFPAQCNVTL
jgi:hypothetical protein